MSYIGDQWVFGDQLGVQNSAITDKMRINVLQSLLMVGVNDAKIIGETCNLVMADHIDSVDTISLLLFTLSISNYRPAS